MRLGCTDNKNKVGRIGTSFDNAEMVLLDRAYCELERQDRK
jgi:hypothetical protein